MAHAGFPNGLNITKDEIADKLRTQEKHIRLILIVEDQAIGEMSYRNVGNKTAEIGIKICEKTKQEKGLGTIFIEMLLDELFLKQGYEKIVLDTNLNNTRAQHVYEKVGFIKVGVRMHSWKDQLGELQSAVDYELLKEQYYSVS
jgi:RimJ/RimL family protein N-acetyltransferase